MRKKLGVIVLLFPVLSPAAEQQISLVPSNKLGMPNGGEFRNIEWKADSEWFGKTAPVCVVEAKRTGFAKFHKLAKKYEMHEMWDDDIAKAYGKRTEGGFYYRSKMIGDMVRVAGGNPATGKFVFKISQYSGFPRDENQKPVVQPLPSREECVVIAREWMKRLGIDENDLYRKGQDPGGFDIVFRIDLVRAYLHGTKIDHEYDYGMTLNFAQQVGGLSTWWHGYGGTLICQIGDGGEFCGMYGTLRPWKKIGDYPVLDREEIEAALCEGFFWSGTPFRCESLEIVKVDLEVYQAIDSVRQKDFPLTYVLYCKLHGGESDGIEANVRIPALRQHRGRYGKVPPFDPEWLKSDMKPALEPSDESGRATLTKEKP